jgi:hypothetical protein
MSIKIKYNNKLKLHSEGAGVVPTETTQPVSQENKISGEATLTQFEKDKAFY